MTGKFKQDVIIIGAGIGGLSAGAYLATKGCKVQIFERLHQHGGFVHTFRRGDYTFEASTHCMSGFENRLYLKNALEILGISDLPLKFHEYAMEAVYYQNHAIRERFLVKAGAEGFNEFIMNRFPDEARHIQYILQESKRTSDSLFRIKRLQRDFPLKYPSDLFGVLCLKGAAKSALLKKLAGIKYSAIFRYKDRNGMDLLDGIRDPRLLFVMTVLGLFFCIKPEECPAYMFAGLNDLFLLTKPQSIRGGTATLLERLVNRLTDNDGRIFYRAKVEKIIVRDNKAVGVRLADGTVHYADRIICNNTAHSMFTELIEDSRRILPAEYMWKIDNYQPSPSAFQVYLGLPFGLDEFGFQAESTVFSGNLDMNSALPSSREKMHDDMAFLLTDYRKTNPEFYQDGKSGIVITRFDRMENWKGLSPSEYKAKKEKVKKAVISMVREISGIPLERAELVIAGTPKTMAFYSGDGFGSMLGADTNMNQSALNRFDCMTPVKNLFLVGADAKPSGGVSACLDSGIIAGRMALRH